MTQPRLKITSDGTMNGTKVTLDGKELPFLMRIDLTCTPESCDAVIHFSDVDIDITSKQCEISFSGDSPVWLPLSMSTMIERHPIKDPGDSQFKRELNGDWSDTDCNSYRPDPSYYNGKKK